MKLSYRLFAGFFTVSLLTGFAAATGVKYIRLSGEAAPAIFHTIIPVTAAAEAVRRASARERATLADYLAATDLLLLDELHARFERQSAELAALLDRIAGGAAVQGRSGDYVVRMRDLSGDARTQRSAALDAAAQLMNTHRESLLVQDPLLAEESGNRISAYLRTFDEFSGRLDASMERVAQTAGDEMKNALRDAYRAQSSARLLLIETASAGLLASLLLAFLFARSIRHTARKLADRIRAVAGGTVAAEPEALPREFSEPETALTELCRTFRDSARGFSAAGGSIRDSSGRLTEAAEQLAARAKEQAERSTQLAGSMEKLNTALQSVTQNSSSAVDRAAGAGDTAARGGEVVDRTVTGMRRIAEAVRELNDVITALGGHSGRIGDIIGVIDSVAHQTNLLALNAAIEAARAGEHGRGFAVVADEVRKLSERTQSSTKEVVAMVKSIQLQTAAALASVEQSVREVDGGMALATQAGDTLKEILTASRSVQDMVRHIALAAQEQAAAAGEISWNIESMASLSRENTTASGDLAAAVRDIGRLSGELETMTGKFSALSSGGQAKSAR